jgi:acyl-[acyl-carrier-protein]-phospholipid O-acyltransferase/long-chain-fatty-acid--[acyl-carrier-protein] ligase
VSQEVDSAAEPHDLPPSEKHNPAASDATSPPLYLNVSFWGLASSQFLGALNENLFRQLILLLATPTLAELAAGTGKDYQSEAQLVFFTALLLFLGLAGFVSDRVGKRGVIVVSKVAETLVMACGAVAFWYYDLIGVAGTLVVLFLLGVQNAFFGPAKYGILPEMLPASHLPRANGIFLLLTFLAVFVGFGLAGGLLDLFRQHIWIAALVCVAIAAVGTVLSLLVRRVPVAQPGLQFRWSSLAVSKDILQLLRRDSHLFWTTVVVAVYWAAAGMYLQTVNALGKSQLGLSDLQTSLLAASSSMGVAIGCLLGGYLSRNRINRTVATTGAAGLAAGLLVMSLPSGTHGHLLGFTGSIPVLLVTGVFAGMFIVPVQVVLQSRPPRAEKGRMIALMNQCNLLGIILGAVLYKGCLWVLDEVGGPRSAVFAVTAALILPIAILYRPNDQPLEQEPLANPAVVPET